MENKQKSDEVEGVIRNQWQEYETYTQILSNCIRQLAYAETAVFWVFSRNGNNLSDSIVFGLIFIVFFFLFDVFHYYCGQVDHYNLAKNSQKKYDRDKNIDPAEIKKHPDVNKRAKLFFKLKLLALGVASVFLTIQFFRQLIHNACN